MQKKIYINLLFIDLGHFYIPIHHKKRGGLHHCTPPHNN